MKHIWGLRALVILGLVATATALGIGSATAAAAGDTQSSIVSVANAGNPSWGRYARYGDTMDVTVQLQKYDTGSSSFVVAPAQDVALQWRRAGKPGWKGIGSTLTDSGGQAVFSYRPRSNGAYRMVFASEPDSGDGTVMLNASTSTVTAQSVERNMPATSVNHGKYVTFKGGVKPRYARKVIYLERTTCLTHCSWHVIAHKRTTRTSHWSFRVGAPKRGSWYFKTMIKPSKQFVRSSSNIILRTYRI